MQSSEELAQKLNESIKNEPLYKDYSEKKAALLSDMESYKKYQAFMKMHIEFQVKLSNGQTPDFAYERSLSSVYGELILIDTVREFIEARQNMTDTIGKIMNIAFVDIDEELI